MNEYECETCTSHRERNVELAGGYFAYLCNTCRNDWAEHCKNTNSFTDLRKHAVFLTMATKARDEKKVESVLEEMERLERNLFQVAKNWVEKKKREKEIEN